ncbi:acyl-CoA carboxylase subunit epsilon [Nocardioides coralli]|uniref:acyl-CoA carboxylase subunit epsilon n=1 Tax=Nocardioides coralli TaxID=2872154 RepID=UPI001CA3BD97|nr:acyl-CoA carboxylase subunit epsilon [Nocardioides coralli]QZY29980.1 acyl-CoA carboxylase subunit epsilon [Nocardioides coralli]
MSGEEKDAATSAEPAATPLLRIITPDTTPEEVAAIVAVLSALGSGETAKPKPASEWNSPYRQVRPFYSHGPGGWRSSGLPKHRGRGN